MKKPIFSALIFCGLLAAAPTHGQSLDTNAPVIASKGDHPGLLAYPENNNIVALRWQGGNEVYIDHFEIDHSTDGIHFTVLHTIVSRGAPDPNSLYEDEDSYPASQTNYYRLEAVEKNGDAYYYPVVRVDLNNKSSMTLKPTVLQMGGTVRLDAYHEQPLTINFFNERGALVRSVMVNSTSFEINTNGWARGMYIYRISDPAHPLINAGKIMVM